MKKSEYKSRVIEVFSTEVDGIDYEEKIHLLESWFLEYLRANDHQREKPNYGKSWSDGELRIILQDAPTKRNCAKYARIFGRGYGSIEQIYRWASADTRTIQEKRPDDAFVAQVKRIAKEVGWRA